MMFVMDMPPDALPQFALAVIVQAAKAKEGDATSDPTIGICQAIGNPAMVPRPAEHSAVNSLGNPDAVVRQYLKRIERREIDGRARVTVVQKPEHGNLETGLKGDFPGNYWYFPKPGYLGEDRAVFLVEIGDLKSKLIFFFKVAPTVDYKIENEVCPEPRMWKISLNPDDPNAPVYTFEHPYSLTGTFDNAIKTNLSTQ